MPTTHGGPESASIHPLEGKPGDLTEIYPREQLKRVLRTVHLD
jgi:hypothetical protein